MIPKVIHYCWFGRNPKPKQMEKCIKSWKKHCPDYEIREWNEDNFDISTAPLYVRQAYEAKKWAFVTDYVRLQVVFENGGIYLDTDVELKKNLDFLLAHRAYFGFETNRNINTGLGFGAEKGTDILRELMDSYGEIPFVYPDGSFDLTPCPFRDTEVFLRHGLRQDDTLQLLDGDILILPSVCLCPISWETRIRRRSRETVSIHWYGASWHTKEERARAAAAARALRLQRMGLDFRPETIKGHLKNLLGDRLYYGIKRIIKGRHGENGAN